jgi:trehalose/maltose hydrolase-like predicted phosphorylase
MWIIREDTFNKQKINHAETIFTIGNGYLSTRGAYEETYPGERRSTFIHGLFDDVPVSFTELVNSPDWLPLVVLLNGERFSMLDGTLGAYERTLDLRSGVLTRSLHWRSPNGRAARLTFERFTSLADEHLLMLRCRVTPEFDGTVEFRAGLNGNMDNLGQAHWEWLEQGQHGGVQYLHCRTRSTHQEVAAAFRTSSTGGELLTDEFWDADSVPTHRLIVRVRAGQEITLEKTITVFTSRDAVKSSLVEAAVDRALNSPGWDDASRAHGEAWEEEWQRADVIIEGDAEAQQAIRFNLFQMLIAAPRHDDRVNIGAKTLSGFGYRGHSFWDTEIFMLPLFTYTSPHIARNLLNYRYQRLPAARKNAAAGEFQGARFPWESADTGEEVTPTWGVDPRDRTKLIRIWTGDIEIHISADIAYAAHQFWQATGDDDWMIAKGAEIILDTAQFWASRAEWNPERGRYELTDVIGPDEYHDHVDNNYYTNRMAQWNLQTALDILEWMKQEAPIKARQLFSALSRSWSIGVR